MCSLNHSLWPCFITARRTGKYAHAALFMSVWLRLVEDRGLLGGMQSGDKVNGDDDSDAGFDRMHWDDN